MHTLNQKIHYQHKIEDSQQHSVLFKVFGLNNHKRSKRKGTLPIHNLGHYLSAGIFLLRHVHSITFPELQHGVILAVKLILS